jgi:4,4'-diaponeurosporenoate glycosyltransferase
LVPARDEEASLPHLLDALAADDDPFQLIVLDDGSVDATAALARQRGVEVVDVPATPPGWAPKNWVLHHGLDLLERAGRSPEVVIFLDADVRPSPGLIGDLSRRADVTGGLVSIQPFHRTDTVVEQLSAPFNLVSMMGVGTAAHPAAHLATRGAFGPVLATRLDAYRQVGGHHSVRSDIVEDMALSERYRSEGRSVEVFGGHDRVSFRMFPLGLRQLVEGWSKNMASGSGRIPRWRTLALVLWVAIATNAAIAATGSILSGQLDAWVLLAAGFVAQFHHHHRQLGNFRWWTAPAYPILLATFMGLFFYSAYRTHLRRSVVWRGRTLRLDQADPTPGPQAVPAP